MEHPYVQFLPTGPRIYLLPSAKQSSSPPASTSPNPVPLKEANEDCRDTDNVDYNSLKHEIKIHTRRDQARAIAIPGQADTDLRRFEEGFYEELCAQHDRVDLFVQSKTAEIASRLGAFSMNRGQGHRGGRRLC